MMVRSDRLPCAQPLTSPASCRGVVHVVDDDREVREALGAVLQAAALDVIPAGSAEEFLDRFQNGWDIPRCVLLDVQMPGLSGLGLQAKLAAEPEPVPVIFLSGQADLQTAVEAMKRGAVDFMEKPVHPRVLLEKVRRALDLDAQRRYQRMQNRRIQLGLQSLSDREQEVMELLFQAKNTKEIAAQLGIGVQTVSKHRVSLFHKLGVRNVVELVQRLSAQG